MSRRPLTQKELEKLAENFYESDSDENSDNDLFREEDNDLSDGISEHSEHFSESELEADSSSDEIDMEIDHQTGDYTPTTDSTNYYYGRNKYKWAKTPPASSRTRKQNIICLPGTKVSTAAMKPSNPVEAWSLLFTDNILDLIIDSTNKKITDLSVTYGNTATFVEHTDKTELTALFGLMIMSGVFKSGHEDAESLFVTDSTGRDIFRATMSKKRFLFLLSALRFDDQDTRNARKDAGDKLAPISEIYEIFNQNCKHNYICSEYAVVDEMLVGFRGRCSFRQYIKSKPKKYGLKIMCICDSKTHYLFNSFIYCRKTNEPNPRKLLIPTMSVMKLAHPILNSNRNITGDNWFSSTQLYVGTMRKNKAEVPAQFQSNKTRVVESSVFGFTKDKTLVSYVPKKNRGVILISSMHHERSVTENRNKPEIIEFYNSTKGGVDALDQKCATYSCQRRTRRWPMAIFGAMLDISRTNSYVLLKTSHIDTKMSRRQFYILLGKPLILGQLRRRVEIQGLSRELRNIIRNVLGERDEVVDQDVAAALPIRQQQKRCYVCPRKRDRKVKTSCTICNKHVCKDHSQPAVKCLNCINRE